MSWKVQLNSWMSGIPCLACWHCTQIPGKLKIMDEYILIDFITSGNQDYRELLNGFSLNFWEDAECPKKEAIQF